MASPEPFAPFRFSTFISYSHADKAFAQKLQADLEKYRLPGRLRREVGRDRLLPVYRDMSDLNAAPDLTEAIKAGLSSSEFLIVVCSPDAARSEWVGREIDHFRSIRGDTHILAALIRGDEATSIHPRLRVRADGSATHPLAADFRPSTGAPRLALLKLTSRLFGVDLDDLVHRDALRKRQRLIGSGIAAFALAAVLGIALLFVVQARDEADLQREASARAMEFQLDKMRAQIKAGGTLSMSAALNHGVELYFEGMPAAASDPGLMIKRAQLLQAKADDQKRRGNTAAAMADAQAAWKLTAAVIGKGSPRPQDYFAHAQSAYWIGDIAWRLGDTPLAARAFGRYDQLADTLLKLEPDNPDWLMEKAYSQSNLGMIALREARDESKARSYFERSKQVLERVAKRKPGDPAIPYALADTHAWLADTARLSGDLDRAEAYRQQQRRIIDALVAGDRDNRLYRIDLVANQLGLARIAHAKGQWNQAFALLDDADQEMTRLVAADKDDRSLAQASRALQIFRAYFQLTRTDRESTKSAAAARSLLGSCEPDWNSDGRSSELGLFCSLTEARLFLARNDLSTAKAILASEQVRKASASKALTPRWMLDPQREAKEISSGITRAAPRSGV